MCGGENVYYTTCGCWSGHVILHTCTRGEALGASHCRELELAGVHRVEGYCIACRRRAEQMKRVGMEYSLNVEDRDEAAARHGAAYLTELIRQEMEKAGGTPQRPEDDKAKKNSKKVRWRGYYEEAGREGQSSSGIVSTANTTTKGKPDNDDDDTKAETEKVGVPSKVSETENVEAEETSVVPELDAEDPLALWKRLFPRNADPKAGGEEAVQSQPEPSTGSPDWWMSQVASLTETPSDVDEAWVVRPLRNPRPAQQQSESQEQSDEFWN